MSFRCNFRRLWYDTLRLCCQADAGECKGGDGENMAITINETGSFILKRVKVNND